MARSSRRHLAGQFRRHDRPQAGDVLGRDLAFTGISGSVVPAGARLSDAVDYETTAQIVLGTGPTEGPVRALTPGAIGNLDAGQTVGLTDAFTGVDSTATVVEMTGGVETENDDDLRFRILQRIQNPAMGGSKADYVTWALAVPGVTRAWAAAEQGPGTITVRFLMDELRADDDGWPQPSDVIAVKDYIDKMRPVTVKDCYVVAPIKQFIDVTIQNLTPETAQGDVEASLRQMLFEMAAPGQTIYAAWVSYAIMNAPDVQTFTMTLPTFDYRMPSLGHMAVLGTLRFDETTAT